MFLHLLGCSYSSVYTSRRSTILIFFFFNATATTEIYTLSLHDALPISCAGSVSIGTPARTGRMRAVLTVSPDRKSTRLNSSHGSISYAVFCLKKKKKKKQHRKIKVRIVTIVRIDITRADS